MPPGPSQASLQTARLTLRPRTAADLEACLAMDLDPRVGEFLYPHGRPGEAERRARLETQLTGDWPPVGGIWVVEWRTAPGFLGWCGLFPLQDSGLVEIGYRYTTQAWGQGVATEAAARVLDFGFRELGLDPIVAVAHPENLAYFELARASYLAGD